MRDWIRDFFADHPESAARLYLLASEIVDDFEDYGGALQANEDSVYDETSTIIQLRDLRNEISRELRKRMLDSKSDS